MTSWQVSEPRPSRKGEVRYASPELDEDKQGDVQIENSGGNQAKQKLSAPKTVVLK